MSPRSSVFVGATLIAAIGTLGVMSVSGNIRNPTVPVAEAPVTHIEMHNVNYHYDNHLAIHIRYLRGRLIHSRNRIPTFDDKLSFSVSIDSAEIAISAADLTTLLNTYVFSYPGSSIKNVKINIRGQELEQTGTAHKGVDMPFQMRSEVSATPDGRIRLHPVSFKVLQVPVEGALHLFGLHIGNLIDPKRAPGIQLVKDDLILDPSQMLPPPKMFGRVANVAVEGDRLIQFFGPVRAREGGTRNYIRFTGGVIRFGKLTMRDADLSLIDTDPSDPFDFSLERYKDQLVAGYSKTTPSFGLDVFMPDITKLGFRRQ
jgi:hypothetical protein